MIAKFGFVRVAAHSPMLRVADPVFNSEQIIQALREASREGAAVALFPELCLTGYSCGDLFLQEVLQREALRALDAIAEINSPCVAIVGLPFAHRGRLYNCAAVVHGGRVQGLVPKLNLPNYQEYYERRWFVSGKGVRADVEIGGVPVPFGADVLFRSAEGAFTFGLEICEDLWTPTPPSGDLAQAGAQLIFNPSASDEAVTKNEYRRGLIAQQSGRCISGYVYAGAGPDESTTDMVFGGSCVVAENGRMLAESPRFTRGAWAVADIDVGRLNFQRGRCSTFFAEGWTPNNRVVTFGLTPSGALPLRRGYTPLPFVPGGAEQDARSEDITSIQVASLRKRLYHTGMRRVAVNVSGGLDSALTLLVAARLFREEGWDASGVHALTLPGFGTGDRTKNNAMGLMTELGCTIREVNISPAVLQHFVDIGHDGATHDITYENSQARERTQILMDYANRIGALALGTGDLSEAALGWSTYNGDHMSMYNVNAGVPKTLVRHLVRWLSEHCFHDAVQAIARDILDTPVTPELIPSKDGEIGQRTEDILGPYELHDFYLYHMLEGGASPAKMFLLAQQAMGDRYDRELMLRTLRTFLTRFFAQQFKRSCVPDGPRVGSVALSPRGDWRMPSDASAAAWIAELDTLN